MIFSYPTAFLLLLVIPLILLLFFLRPRPKRRTISSLFLFNLSLEKSQKKRRIANILRYIDIILIIAILLSLVLSLSRPVIPRKSLSTEGNRIILLDGSASMLAREAEGKRFSLAQEEALRLLHSFSSGTNTALILGKSEPEIVSSFTKDKKLLERRITALGASEVEADIQEALKLALSLTSTNTKIHLISDTAFSNLPLLNQERDNIEVHRIGTAVNNIGITLFSTRPAPGRTSSIEALAAFANYSSEESETILRFSVDGNTIEERSLSLGPNEEDSLLFRYDGPRGVLARIEVLKEDALLMDNSAYSVISDREEIDVALIGPGNVYLETALRSLPHLRLIKSETYTPDIIYDVMIFDRYRPPPLKEGKYLFIDTIPAGLDFSIQEKLNYSLVEDWSSEHPLLQSIQLGDIRMSEAKSLEGASDALPLIRTFKAVIAYALERDDLRAIVLGFDILASDFPLRIAFPIFVSNSISWLESGEISGYSSSAVPGAGRNIKSGSRAPLLFSKDDYPLRVEKPDGTESKLDYQGIDTGFTFAPLAGIYRFSRRESNATSFLYAANLSSRRESNLIPRLSLPEPTAESGGSKEEVDYRPFFTTFLALCLILLIFELFVWERRFS